MSFYSDLSRHFGSGERMLDAVKRNPEGLLLLAAGCALLMRSRSSSSRSGAMQRPGYTSSGEWQRTYAASAAGERPGMRDRTGLDDRSENGGSRLESMRNGLSSAAQDVRESASSAAEQAGQTVRSYASSASDYASEMQRQAADYASHASDYARRMASEAQTSLRDTVDYVLREQPMAVAMAGLAAGAGLAALFPTTRLEKETFGEVGARITGAIQQKGEELKETAAKAGERLKEAAQDPSKLKESLSGIADDVQRSASNVTQGEGNRSKGQGQAGSSAASPDVPGRTPLGNGTASGRPADPTPGTPPKYLGDRR